MEVDNQQIILPEPESTREVGMKSSALTIGIDFGTDSVRTAIIETGDGSEVSSAVADYRRWSEGRYSDPASNRFRQHPLDYIEGLEVTVLQALEEAPAGTADRIVGLSVDTTGSTPVAIDRSGTPLALTEGFEENPNAMFVLWKDHTAVAEAEEINRAARSWGGEDFSRYSGGIYSSEWFWSKILHILRADPKVSAATWSWIEHCDWIPALLTGNTDALTIRRSRCAAGHKAMWHTSFEGLPSEEFLRHVDPRLEGLRDRLYRETWTIDTPAGQMTEEWAGRLGLPAGITVGVGAIDAHLGAVGAEIAPYILSKVMGTSTCDMLVAPPDEIGERTIRGICGQVDGSILPGMVGMEAGQSAFGDVYAWFRKMLAWPLALCLPEAGIETDSAEDVIDSAVEKILPLLSEEAARLPIDDGGIVALDWLNGRRTPDADQALKGALTGLTLGSDPPRIFRALVEATAFGARAIVDRFIEEGVPIKGVIALGGIPKRSPFVMQVVTDVLDVPIRVARAEQACALGSAMAAATAAGVYGTIEEAQRRMGNGFDAEYRPDRENAERYRDLYDRYRQLGSFIDDTYTIRR